MAAIEPLGVVNGYDKAQDIVGDGSVDYKGRPSIRSKSGAWKATFFLYVLLVGDSVCVLALLGNLVQYLFGTLHLAIADCANMVAYFLGTTYLLPLFWGFLSDSYLGRYWSIAFTGLVQLAGIVILTISASVPSLQPPKCYPTEANPVCDKASQHVLNWFYAGLFLIAVGSAGLKPSMTSMGQDQFDLNHPKEKQQGAHFFTVFYLILQGTVLFNSTFLFYIQDQVGFNWGYGVIAGIYFVALAAFYAGTPFYRQLKPGGSAFTRVVRVLVAAFKNRSKSFPKDPSQLYQREERNSSNTVIQNLLHTDRLRFLDKAAIPTHDDGDKEWETCKWNLCTLTQVEEVKSLVQILPIWFTTIAVYINFSQVLSFTQQQASSLNRHVGGSFTIPTGSVGIILAVAALFFSPILEFLIVPVARKRTGHPQGLSPLQRIGLGLVLAIIAMSVAAVVEQKRVNVITNHHVGLKDLLDPKGKIPMSVFWLAPQFAILGIVELLIGVAQLNFFYHETPESMKSVATALYFTSVSVGYFLSTALVKAVNRYTKSTGGWLANQFFSGGLRNYYWLLTVVLAINLVIFLFFAHWYTYKKVDNVIQDVEKEVDLTL